MIQSGINNSYIDGIKAGDLSLTYDIFFHGVETVPYLMHPLGEAKLLFDRKGNLMPLLEKVREYIANHPEVSKEWNAYSQLLKAEKAQYGYEKTTIVDVWNELEKRYSDGKIKRRFFNSFYMTNPFIFSLVKKLLYPPNLRSESQSTHRKNAVHLQHPEGILVFRAVSYSRRGMWQRKTLRSKKARNQWISFIG